VFFALRTVAKCYIRVPPNEVAVVYGRKFKDKETGSLRGYRYVVGGGFVLIPILEKLQVMSLNTMQVEATVKDVPDKDGALISVMAIANVKIQSDDQALPLAIERFLGNTEEQIVDIIKNMLEGNLRAIVGKMEIQELLRDRQKFMQTVLAEAGEDLGKMGIAVDVAQIQDIRDPRGYIESLGKKKTAEVVRDATVGQAEAQRETDQKSATAKQAGETAKAEADLAISNANRDRDMGIADNDAKVAAQRAQVPIAAEIAAANRTAELNTSKVAAEKAAVTASIELQSEQQRLNEATLEATIVTSAKKEKDARIIAAEAQQQAASIEGEAFRIKSEKEGQGAQAKAAGEAEANRIRMEKEGQGTKAKQTAEADGRKAIASAVQAEREAAAAGEQAELLAKAKGKEADLLAIAAGTKAQKLAEADGIRAALLAEAEGVLKKAEAFKELDEAGRFLMILQSLPPVIDAIGVAAEKALTPTAQAIGQGLANVKEMRIIDMGGSGQADGKNVVSQFINLPVETVFGLVQKLKASGMMPMAQAFAAKYGFNLDEMLSRLPAQPEAAAPAAEKTT
jgi:flotillin